MSVLSAPVAMLDLNGVARTVESSAGSSTVRPADAAKPLVELNFGVPTDGPDGRTPAFPAAKIVPWLWSRPGATGHRRLTGYSRKVPAISGSPAPPSAKGSRLMFRPLAGSPVGQERAKDYKLSQKIFDLINISRTIAN